MTSSSAWSSCGNVNSIIFLRDFLRGTETIAVQVLFSEDSNQSAVKVLKPLIPQIYQIIANQIPKDSNLKVVNYSDISDAEGNAQNGEISNTTIFKLVIKATEIMPNYALFSNNITLILTKPGASKELTHEVSLDIPSVEEHFLSAFKPLTREAIQTVICLNYKSCPPPEPCSGSPHTQRTKINSEDDVLQRMKELEGEK